jgi:hypothetical protein
MTFFEDDVFLVSYPRSGNTWMRYLIARMKYPDRDWTLENINQAVPDIYETSIDDCPRPRLVKSHEPHNTDYPRVVYLYRDGRDVAVSYFNLSQTAYGYKGTFADFLSAMLSGLPPVGFGPWQDHVTKWLSTPSSDSFLPVRYETLCKDTFRTLRTIADFIGLAVDADTIRRAMRASTFSRVKDDVRKNSPFFSSGYKGGVKGGPGKWKEIFDKEMNENFWNQTGTLMQRLGYKKSKWLNPF